jgi:hypothetical protein
MAKLLWKRQDGRFDTQTGVHLAIFAKNILIMAIEDLNKHLF